MTSQLGVIVNGPWSALECVRIPPVMLDGALDTLGYPLTTSSDAHFPEHVGRRPFTLDVSAEALLGGNGEADMKVLRKRLQEGKNITNSYALKFQSYYVENFTVKLFMHFDCYEFFLQTF